jgi:RNA polymerase sigma factor (sigma-70 family)
MSSPAQEPAAEAANVAARVERLYADHASNVRGLCRSLLRDRADAEDAAQQTFLSAQRALQNGTVPRDPRAWLVTIARHECLARARARMREPLPVDTESSDIGADAHAIAVRRQEVRALREALAGLPAQQREAILLRELRGFSYDEVAAALAVTTPAVESLIFRARRSLQVRLRESFAGFVPSGLVQALRELAARVAGGGIAVPAAAKIAAVGLGSAVATGGALELPNSIGLGHAPNLHNAAPARQVHAAKDVRAPIESRAVWRPVRQVASHSGATAREPGDATQREPSDGRSGTSQTEASDRQGTAGTGGTETSDTSQREASDGSTSGSDGGTPTTETTTTPTTTTSTDSTTPTSTTDSGSSSDGATSDSGTGD